MMRLLPFVIGVGLVLPLSGCGDTCESVQEEITKIGHEIQQGEGNPLERTEELGKLKDKLVEMGCLNQ